MSDLLSQDQIDDLFGAGGGFQAPPEEEEAPPAPELDVQVYDFRRPARISKDRKRSLEAIYGLFVKSFEGWLAGRTRAPIHFSLKGLDQLTFGEFQMSLAPPCASFTLDVVQSPAQHAVIDFGPELAFYLMDRLLGGPGRQAGSTRALTIMERRVVRIVAAKAAGQLTEVWQEYAELDLMVAGFESIPEMLRAASREDPYLVANMEVVAGDVVSGLSVAIPFAALDAFFAADSNQGSDTTLVSPTRALDRKAAEGTLRGTGVEVSARLPHFSVPFDFVSRLQPGSLLTSPHFPDTEVELILNGQTRYVGRAGRSGPKLAVEITEALEEDPQKDRRTL